MVGVLVRRVTVRDMLTLLVGVDERDGDAVFEGEWVAVGDAEIETESEADSDTESLCEGVPLPVEEGDRVAVGDAETVMESLEDNDGVRVFVGESIVSVVDSVCV